MEKEEFIAKVSEVAKVLGMQIAEHEDYGWNHREIVGDNSISISVSNPTYPKAEENKLRFHGNFPHGTHGSHYGAYNAKNEISVSADKSVERIAKDIQHRLLPDYLEALNKALEAKKVTEDREAKEIANLKKLADYFGVELTNRGADGKMIWVSHPLLDSKIKVYDEDRVEFTLRLNPDATIRVFDFLKLKITDQQKKGGD
jgi:hypothetical protein